MSTNQYANIDDRINSCLIGANCYRVVSPEEEFALSLVEEISDSMRQTPGRSYMRARADGRNGELWMVPFFMGQAQTLRFLDTVEEVMVRHMGKEHFFFPIDVVSDQDNKAYLMRPIDRERYLPIRTFMPKADAPRWKIAGSLFRRVDELGQMGLTSNGLSREQIRVCRNDFEVTVWLNETMSLLDGSDDPDRVMRHLGFLSIPEATEKDCRRRGIAIDGKKRDIYSAAIAAFYLILYTHPFVGSAFYGMVRSDYLISYQNWPQYILEAGSENNLGNQMLSRVVSEQWERTVPELKALFNGIFLAVTHPDRMWDDKAAYWDPQAWMRALDLDAKANDNEKSRIHFHFENEMYHQV